MIHINAVSQGDINRFWSRVDKSDPNGCWIYVGGRDTEGYGQFWVAGSNMKAHQFALLITNGRWPTNTIHDCDTPACMHHIREGTQAENIQMMYDRDRSPLKKLSNEAVQLVRSAYKTGMLQKDIADALGVSASYISRLVNHKRR